MKKRFVSMLAVLLVLSACLTSCQTVTAHPGDITDSRAMLPPLPEITLGEDKAGIPSFYRKVAREVHDDGWVFSFIREGYKDPEKDESTLYRYIFNGMNIRYYYAEIIGGKSTPEAYTQDFMLFGTGSEAERRDMKIVGGILQDPKMTDEALLALDPADYTFEVLDGEMFFRLMHQALLGEPQEEGTHQSYWDKYSFAFLTEPNYIDNYQFQIAFINATGLVDELYIDVRYKTGTAKHEYVQLSDLVESGKATPEQVEAFELIQKITQTIKDTDWYITDADTYKDKVIGGIDFYRLYNTLLHIHVNDFDIFFQ